MEERHRKAQALPLSRMVRSQTRDSGAPQKVGTKGENVEERKSGNDKEVSSLSVKANGTGVTSV